MCQSFLTVLPHQSELSVHSFVNKTASSFGGKFETTSSEELLHEFDPVETQGVQEALKDVHAHQHAESGPHKDVPPKHHRHNAVRFETSSQTVVIENLGKLGMSKGESP